MRNIVRGHRPDLTPAQIVGGIPVFAELLHAFGIYTLSAAQEASLSKATTYALGLVGADAIIRVGRNHADAKRDAAALSTGGQPPLGPPEEEPEQLGSVLDDGAGDLPDDDEEFAAPPPEALDDEPTEPAVVQPSQRQ